MWCWDKSRTATKAKFRLMGSINEVIQRYIRAITRMVDWRCKTMARVSGHYMLVWESLTVVGLQWTGPHCSLCTGLWGRVITKTPFRGPQCSATQRHSPGLLIIQAQLEWAYWIKERPWPQKDRPHKETTTNKNNSRHNDEKENDSRAKEQRE